MVDLKKIGGFVKKSILITLAAGAMYYVGLKQNPSFQELTPKVQQVLIQEHNQLDSLLKSVSDDCARGNLKGAITKFEDSKKLVNMLSKIDPKFKELNPKIEEYEQFINVLGNAVSYMNVKDISKIIKLPPKQILNFVTGEVYYSEVGIDNIILFCNNPQLTHPLSPEVKELSLRAAQQLCKEGLTFINDLRNKISARKDKTSIPEEVQELERALKIIDTEIIPKMNGHLRVIEHRLK